MRTLANLNKLLTQKTADRMGADYYKRVKNLLYSGYSQDRARFAALHPKTF